MTDDPTPEMVKLRAARTVRWARWVGVELGGLTAVAGPITPAGLVRAVMAADGLTQVQLAERCGIGQPQIARLAAGKRAQMKPATAIRLEAGTGVPAEVWVVLGALAALDGHT